MRDADLDDFGDDSPSAGVSAGTDCDDGRLAVRPGGTETCATAYDDDCDTDDNDEGALGCTTYFADTDGDGQGDPGSSECHCEPEGVFSEADSLDCDDDDAGIYSGATESCDAIDSDCDGSLRMRRHSSDAPRDVCGKGGGVGVRDAWLATAMHTQ